MDAPLRDEIARLAREAGVPGCAIATTTADGRVETVEVGRAGLRPPRAVEPTTRFHLFSGTKLYTATAVMRLVEEGALALDEPVAAHLPELPLAHPVTPRQLLAHDAGLRDTLRAFLAVHPADVATPTTGEALARYRLDHGRAPGSGARYTNAAYAILGELVTRAAGVPYERFVRDAVLAPLGSDADFAPRADDAAGHVPRFSPMRAALRVLLPGVARWIEDGVAEGRVELAPFSLDTIAVGGLVGAARAFVPLLREMLSVEDGLLRATSKREMLTLQAPGAVGIASRDGVGLGWKRGPGFWNHEGGGPGFCSETRIYPEAGVGVVILMNQSQSRRLSMRCHALAERLARR